MLRQRFLRRWINRFSRDQIELRQVQCTCDTVPGEKAHGQVVLLVSTGSIPRVDCSFNVDDEDPLALVFYSLHRPRGKLGHGTDFDESSQGTLTGTCSVSRTDPWRRFLFPVLLRIPGVVLGLEEFVLPFPATSLR